MKKGTLLNLILKRCEDIGRDGGVSIDDVLVETLKFLAEYEPSAAKKYGLGKSGAADANAVGERLKQFNIDFKITAENMTAAVTVKPSCIFLGQLLYKNVNDICEATCGDGEVTLDKFIEYALSHPSFPVKRFIFGEEDEEVVADAAAEIDDEDEEDEEETEPTEEQAKLEEARKRAIRELLADLGEDDSDEEEEEEEDEDEEDEEEEDNSARLAKIAKKSKEIHEYLASTVYGQDVAVNTFVSGYFQAELTCLTDKARIRPRATFLFAGPPGVGKTFLSEQVAKALKLPFRRFDMSEYSDKEANLEFCGSDKVYKNSKAGNVTSFVAEHPDAILLFDEVEKAHLNVIHLFLQILDAGRLRDNYTDEEVSFKDTIIIFTTNAGKSMYEDDSLNLSTVSRKAVLRALSQDVNPVTNAPMFPAAICSRFAYGNVVMFNRMSANYLLQIAEHELNRQTEGIESGTGIKITLDPLLPYAIIYAEGGVADARTVKGKSGAYIFGELYELFRLMQSQKLGLDVGAIKKINIKVELPDDEKIASLFIDKTRPHVLIFADDKVAKKAVKGLGDVVTHVVSTVGQAEEVLREEEISLILCDVTTGADGGKLNVLNVEDVESEGRKFMYYAAERVSVPLYVLEKADGEISDEEFTSLAAIGATGIISLGGKKKIADEVKRACSVAYQQKNLINLARANKVVTHKTLQRVNADGTEVEIALFDFKLATALDAGDTDGVLDKISKPNVKFDDVIGAKDAKEELSYFIDYLKNASKFIKRGVRAPKGILLYGPPGTGKTLLAKAMAGESDVTFIRAEGNQFLKKFVGEGAESVHALFKTARKYAPSILFIDEIDAIAKGRGDNTSHSDDVLTSFLTEMDGFNTDTDRPVFVLAATNYDIEQGTSRSLDPALLRRFDRKIYVDLPGKDERIQFLKGKLAKIAHNRVSAEQVENIAARSTGASLADLDSVLELALRNVIKSKELELSDVILEEAFETFNGGDAKKWNDGELMRTARHEAGHALMCYLSGETPSYLTIVARGSHGGYMQHADNEGKGTYTKKELLDRVRTALGGRGAEVVYYGEEDGVSTGASGDLRQATAIVENMICSYGMDEKVGLSSIDLKNIATTPHYSQIMERINDTLAEEFAFVKRTLSEHRAAIDALVAALMDKNALKSNEIEEILKSNVKK